MADAAYLSIGEVLGILLEEFPDVTISKIRFLESQGLIEPERTPSGYRKFYDNDVDLLRAILREQKDNFLPLKVIRDRIESGEIERDPTGSHTLPRGIKNVEVASPSSMVVMSASAAEAFETGVSARDSVFRRTDQEPAAESMARTASRFDQAEAIPSRVEVDVVEVDVAVVAVVEVADEQAAAAILTPVVTSPPDTAGGPISADELCSVAGLGSEQLAALEQYGVIARSAGPNGSYGREALRIAKIAGQLMNHGVDARHLRGWKQSAEREAALFEQLVTPLVRQRNPQSRRRAFDTLGELADLGGQLREALMESFVQSYAETN